MKKILLLLLSSFIILTSSDVSFAAFSENADKKEGYDGIILVESNNTTFDKYILQENGVENELIVDKVRNVYVVNGYEYTEDAYFNAVNEQVNDIENGIIQSIDKYLSGGLLSKMNYNILVETNNNNENIVCMYANCNPNEVPKTGYGEMNYKTSTQKYAIAIALTSAAIGAFASWFTGGKIDVARYVIQAAVEFFATYGITTATGDANQAIWQAYHTSCPSTKQEIRYTITKIDKNGVKRNFLDTTTTYFYHSKPW